MAISSRKINQRALIMLRFEALVNVRFLDAGIASMFPVDIVEEAHDPFNLIGHRNIEYKRQVRVMY
jgi:hypothetical protein